MLRRSILSVKHPAFLWLTRPGLTILLNQKKKKYTKKKRNKSVYWPSTIFHFHFPYSLSPPQIFFPPPSPTHHQLTLITTIKSSWPPRNSSASYHPAFSPSFSLPPFQPTTKYSSAQQRSVPPTTTKQCRHPPSSQSPCLVASSHISKISHMYVSLLLLCFFWGSLF
jgi:hypothetical protein